MSLVTKPPVTTWAVGRYEVECRLSTDLIGVETHRFDVLFKLFSVYFPIAFIIVGFFGNVLAFLTIGSMHEKGALAAFHFKALAIADILAVNDFMQAVVMQAAPELVIPWGVVFCKEYHFNGYFFYGVSVWCVVTLTLDRFIAVCFPLRAATWCTLKKGRIMLVSNIVVHIPVCFTFLWTEFYPPGEHGINHEMCLLPIWFPHWLITTQELFNTIFDAYIPIVLVSCGNISILVNLRRRARNTVHLGTARADREDTSIIVMLLTMSSAFVVFILAGSLDYLFWNTFTNGRLTEQYPDARNLSYCIAYLLSCSNNVFNFYMYLLSSSSFRRNLRKLFKEWWTGSRIFYTRKRISAPYTVI